MSVDPRSHTAVTWLLNSGEPAIRLLTRRVFGCTEQWADITASLGDAGRAPAWYRSSQPYSPGIMSSFSRSSHYFSPVL
jgi:hypothetical protein